MPRNVMTGIVLAVIAVTLVPTLSPVCAQVDTPPDDITGSEGSGTSGNVSSVDAVDDTATAAATASEAASSEKTTAESTVAANQRKRNAIILAMLVAGIALTGLLLIIAAIAVRGFLRKMARQSEAKRRAELALPPDVAAAAGEAPSDVDESIPFSERETEVT